MGESIHSKSHKRISEALAAHMLALICQIPAGSVATYGQIARLAGKPRHARMVGRLLGNLPPTSQVPWHRVVNGQGRISLRAGGEDAQDCESRQARLLAMEGVVFQGGRISLRRYLWEPVPDENWPEFPQELE